MVLIKIPIQMGVLNKYVKTDDMIKEELIDREKYWKTI